MTRTILTAGLAVLVAAVIGYAVATEPQSGFLLDYSRLEPDPDFPGAMIYKKAGATPKSYDKVAVDEVVFWYAQDSPYKEISPRQLQAIGTTLRNEYVEVLKQHFEVVDKVGPGVMRIRAAITEVDAKKKKRNPLAYLPLGAAVREVRAVTGGLISLQDAQLEIEVLDGGTDDLLYELVSPPARQYTEGEKTSWSQIEKTTQYWAQQMERQLALAEGR